MGTSTLALLFTNPLASGECEQNEQSEGVTAEVRLYLPIVCVWRSGGGDWPTPLIPPPQPPPPLHSSSGPVNNAYQHTSLFLTGGSSPRIGSGRR